MQWALLNYSGKISQGFVGGPAPHPSLTTDAGRFSELSLLQYGCVLAPAKAANTFCLISNTTQTRYPVDLKNHDMMHALLMYSMT